VQNVRAKVKQKMRSDPKKKVNYDPHLQVVRETVRDCKRPKDFLVISGEKSSRLGAGGQGRAISPARHSSAFAGASTVLWAFFFSACSLQFFSVPHSAFPRCRKPHFVNAHVQVQVQAGSRIAVDLGSRITAEDLGSRELHCS
jgi:hypothetical protein